MFLQATNPLKMIIAPPDRPMQIKVPDNLSVIKEIALAMILNEINSDI